jgi:hypothetical protein
VLRELMAVIAGHPAAVVAHTAADLHHVDQGLAVLERTRPSDAGVTAVGHELHRQLARRARSSGPAVPAARGS